MSTESPYLRKDLIRAEDAMEHREVSGVIFGEVRTSDDPVPVSGPHAERTPDGTFAWHWECECDAASKVRWCCKQGAVSAWKAHVRRNH